jgi:hypothetical protein
MNSNTAFQAVHFLSPQAQATSVAASGHKKSHYHDIRAAYFTNKTKTAGRLMKARYKECGMPYTEWRFLRKRFKVGSQTQ